MFKWIVKKVILSKLNDTLDLYKDDVSKIKNILQVWIIRLEKIISCFKSLLSKFDDGKIESDEIDQTVADIEIVIKEW